MTIAQKKHFKKLLFLFLVWPFLSFLTALRTVFNPASQKIILAFSFIFGYTVYVYGGDIVRYGEAFKSIYKYNWSDYFFLIENLLSPDKFRNYTPNAVNTQPDIFAISLQFIISRFTDNPRWFWAIVSTFYTYSVLNLANFTFAKIAKKSYKSYIYIGLWFCFFLVIPFYVGVTGVRYWPALFLFTYFLLRYINQTNAKTIFLLFIPTLIHYSFIIPAVLALVFSFLPKSNTLYKISIILSLTFFYSSNVSSVFDGIREYTSVTDGTQLEQRLNSYTNTDDYERRQKNSQQNNWYVSLRGDLLFYFLVIIGILTAFNILRWEETEFSKLFYHHFIFFMCLALITYNLGSIGRLKNIFIILSSVRFISLFYKNKYSKSFKQLTYVFFLIVIFNTIVNFRAGFYFVDPLLLIHNTFTFLFVESPTSLSEFLIGH